MKLTVFLIIIGSLQVSATGYSQNVTLSTKNTPLEKVFKSIQSQTGYGFFYDKAWMKRASHVTIDVKNTPLVKALDLCFLNQPLTYDIIDETIVVKEKENPTGKAHFQIMEMAFAPIEIRGKVTDENGVPLANVSVILKGTKTGTQTNEKGEYSLSDVDETGTLIFTSVGFEVLETRINNRTQIDVQLKVKMQELDETVIIAYGTTTKKVMTGAVSTIKAEDIKDIPSVSIANLLQGRVAGMDITNMSGAPGGGGTGIVIRGYNSLDVEQERRYSNPLWVVDGVPLNSFTSPVTGTNLLSDINPDMIESIQVLKDASAAAIYGSRAANGVILVTTKKGAKNQKAAFSVNASRSLSILPRLPTVTIGNLERQIRLAAFKNNPVAYIDPETRRYTYPVTYKQVYDNPGSGLDYFWQPQTQGNLDNGMYLQDSLNDFYSNSTNFFPMYFQTAQVTNANFQAYGGTQTMNYGIGVGYYNESGILKGTGFNRVDLNTSMNVTPTNRINVDARFSASLSDRKRGYKSESEYLKSASPVETVPGDPYKLSSLLPGEGSEVWNYIVGRLNDTRETNKSTRLRSNVKVSFDILDGLVFSTSGSADFSLEKRNYFQPTNFSTTGRNKTMGESAINLMALNENLLSYQRSFREKHNFNIIAGLSYQYDRMEYNGGSAQNLPTNRIYYASPYLPTLGEETAYGRTNPIALQGYQSDMTEKALVSYFGRVEYNYRQKYLLSMAIRRDGSSVFGENNKWGTFPSIGTGYNFSDDLHWKAMNFGKIRASWGRSGMQFYKPYLALGILEVGMPYEGNATIEPDWFQGLYNKDLSWEQTDQYDIGLDLDFWNSRLGIVTDYYYRYTDRMLNRVVIPGSGTYGSYYSQWRNAAAISNEGVELHIKYEIIRKPEMYWKVSVNGAKNWNRFAKSYNGRDDATGYMRIIGKPLNGVWVYKTDGFVNNQKDLPVIYNAVGQSNYYAPNFNQRAYYQPGDYYYVDINGSGDFGGEDYWNAGSALPQVSGGLVNEFRYRNFDCNILLSFQLGRHIYNSLPGTSIATDLVTYFIHPLLLDMTEVTFWKEKGSQPMFPTLQLEASAKNMFSQPVDRFVQKVNWMKLKTVTLGYNWKNRAMERAGISQLRFFFSGENLLTFTNYKGLDPETVDVSNGFDGGINYPLARKFTFGITTKF